MYVQNNEITDVFPSKGHSAACVPQVHDINLRKYRKQLIDYAIEDPTRTIDDSYRMVINLINEEDPNYAAFFPPKEKLSSLYNVILYVLFAPCSCSTQSSSIDPHTDDLAAATTGSSSGY